MWEGDRWRKRQYTQHHHPIIIEIHTSPKVHQWHSATMHIRHQNELTLHSQSVQNGLTVMYSAEELLFPFISWSNVSNMEGGWNTSPCGILRPSYRHCFGPTGISIPENERMCRYTQDSWSMHTVRLYACRQHHICMATIIILVHDYACIYVHVLGLSKYIPVVRHTGQQDPFSLKDTGQSICGQYTSSQWAMVVWGIPLQAEKIVSSRRNIIDNVVTRHNSFYFYIREPHGWK